MKEESKEIITNGKEALKAAAGIPIEAVKTTVEVEKEGLKMVEKAIVYPIKKRRSIQDFFWKSKRGVITGCADNDPAGIVTYTQTGAIAGYRLLWLALLAWPLLVAIEEMSARIGVVTKKGINQVITEHYGRFWAYLAALIVLICNTFTIGADIAAMADISAIVTKLPSIIFVILFGGLFFYLLWKKGYKIVSRYLFILTPIFFLYIASALLLDVPWGLALRSTFIPELGSINLSLATIAVAFLGTTLSPYLIYWETTQEIEEKKEVSQLKIENRGTILGMFFTQFITFFIVVAAAAAFGGNFHEISSAKEAALALKPLGNLSFLFFSLGILGSGLLGIPVLAATTGYAASETFGWRRGLDEKVSSAHGFYIVMISSLLVGILIALLGFNPVLMLVYSQVLNGILMPILIILLLLISNNRKIMATHTNRLFTNFFGILAFFVCLGFDILMIYNWLKNYIS
ncbi:MAG: divalent metal cation transporter [Patescibacteria group bacterium]